MIKEKRRTDCLTGQKVETSTAFIEKIETIKTNENKDKVKIILVEKDVEDITYMIGNIEISESNIELLWRLYEDNIAIETAIIYEKDYIIMNFLGLIVALVEAEETTYKSIDIVLN